MKSTEILTLRARAGGAQVVRIGKAPGHALSGRALAALPEPPLLAAAHELLDRAEAPLGDERLRDEGDAALPSPADALAGIDQVCIVRVAGA